MVSDFLELTVDHLEPPVRDLGRTVLGSTAGGDHGEHDPVETVLERR